MSDSSFELQGAALALAWFFAVNLAASAVVILGARRGGVQPSSTRPYLWFSMRMFPALSSIVFVAAILIPSYLRFEPRETIETVDVTLAVCALAAVVILFSALYRGISAWRAAARRTRTWMRTSRPIALPGTLIPAFEIDADTPMLALTGIILPRLLVTHTLVAALTPEELAASVAHEIRHSHARDNLKRLLMRSAPDVFGFTAAARTLERRWAAAAEHRADRIAADADPTARCALAAALVKVARLAPAPPALGEPISTLVGGGDIASRVRSLLEDRARPSPTRFISRRRLIQLVSAFLGIAVIYGPLLRAVHQATEALVQVLP